MDRAARLNERLGLPAAPASKTSAPLRVALMIIYHLGFKWNRRAIKNGKKSSTQECYPSRLSRNRSDSTSAPTHLLCNHQVGNSLTRYGKKNENW